MNSGKFVQQAQSSPDGASTLASATPPNSSSVGQKKAISAQARLSKKKPSLFARLFSCFSSSKSTKNDGKRRYSGPEAVMTAGTRAKMATSSSVATNASLPQDKPSQPQQQQQQPQQQQPQQQDPQQQRQLQQQEQQHLDTSQQSPEKPTETNSTAHPALFPNEVSPEHDIQHQPAAPSPQPIIEEPEKAQYTINENSNDYNEFDDDDDEDDLVDEDSLISSSVLSRPIVIPAACATTAGGKKRRKACKDCTCGLKEFEQQELEKQQQSVVTLNLDEEVDFTVPGKPVGSCGSCALGDAFRCDGCPYLGLPPFKPGEIVSVGGVRGDY